MITNKEVRSLICEHAFTVPIDCKDPCCPLCAHPAGDVCIDVELGGDAPLPPLNIALLRVGVVLGEQMLNLTEVLHQTAIALLKEAEKVRLLRVENGSLRAAMLELEQLREKPQGSVSIREEAAARIRWESALRGEAA